LDPAPIAKGQKKKPTAVSEAPIKKELTVEQRAAESKKQAVHWVNVKKKLAAATQERAKEIEHVDTIQNANALVAAQTAVLLNGHVMIGGIAGAASSGSFTNKPLHPSAFWVMPRCCPVLVAAWLM
jgi:hypothetical protein